MRQHLYPHLKYDRKLVEQAYQDGLKVFNSMSQEERIKNGFGENGHAHPRRFYIFIDKYFKEVKYFMNDKERTQYVFPWIIATRSERKAALKKSPIYFEIKQIILGLAKSRYKCYKLDKEIDKLRNANSRIR